MTDQPDPLHHAPARLRCACFIIPSSVLRRCGRDERLDEATRKALQATARETERLRGLREAHRLAALQDDGQNDSLEAVADDGVVEQLLYNCRARKSLPGRPVPRPKAEYQQVASTTAKVVEFYASVLGRHSLDRRGADLSSSLHYGQNYDNAFWNGQQMVYGDGSGRIFKALYLAPDVIGHELTHGVTQYESALAYQGESGALNESLSDVFGAVFHQWLNGWDVHEPRGWLIGEAIMAQPAQDQGWRCLRDMVNPGAAHVLSPQPDHVRLMDASADVHENSGIPNKAFVLFAQALGGQAWELAVKVWYDVATNRALRPDARFTEFARLSVAAAKARGGAKCATACRNAWKKVGVAIR